MRRCWQLTGAGIKTVILPKRNLKDLIDVPKRARNELKIVPVEHVDQVLAVALAPAPEKAKAIRPKKKATAHLASTEKTAEAPAKAANDNILTQPELKT